MKKLLFVFFTILSLSIYSQERRLALVIGNSMYENGGILKNPVNDAELMASTLLELGFDVMKRTDVTKQEMDLVVLDFWRMMASYDVTLLYYAGHGVQVGGINYILPVDSKLEDELAIHIEAINVENVIKQFERYSDNINIVILDACRDNPFRTWMRSGETGFVPMQAPSGTIIAFATAPGATAADGAGLNGLYTEKLVQQMRIYQRIEDVFIKTRNEVRLASNGRQNPQEWSQLTGSFYFIYEEETKMLADEKKHEDHSIDLATKIGQKATEDNIVLFLEDNASGVKPIVVTLDKDGNLINAEDGTIIDAKVAAKIDIEKTVNSNPILSERLSSRSGLFRTKYYKGNERIPKQYFNKIIQTDKLAASYLRESRIYCGIYWGLLGGSVITMVTSTSVENRVEYFNAEPYIKGALIATLAALIPAVLSGISHNKAISTYNKNLISGLNIKPTENGIGLVYRF